MMGKDNFIKKLIKESVEEMVTTYDNHADFLKNGIGYLERKERENNDKYNNQKIDHKIPALFLYHNTSTYASNKCADGLSPLENMLKNGPGSNVEYYGENYGLYYGMGIYGCLDFDKGWQVGGNACVKFYIKRNAFDNFLIFSPGARRIIAERGGLSKQYENESFEDNLKRLIPQDVLDELKRKMGRHYQEMISTCNDNDPRKLYSGSGWCQQLVMVERHSGGKLVPTGYLNRDDKIIKVGEKEMPAETTLLKTNIAGYAYQDSYSQNDSVTCVVRDTSILMPYKYYTGSRTRPVEHDCIKDDEHFDALNNWTDAYTRAGKWYPDTQRMARASFGFTVVRNGDKYNYIRGGKIGHGMSQFLSPFMDFDYAGNFVNGKAEASVYVPAYGQEFYFAFFTNDYGKIIKVLCADDVKYASKLNYDENGMFSGEGDEGHTTEMTYDAFLKVTESFGMKSSSMLEENVEEDVDEVFTHKNRTDFLNSKYTYVYSRTDHKNLDSILKNGMAARYLGTAGDNSIMYGISASLSYDWEGVKLNTGYGDTVIKFALKDGFKNIVIFDDALRNKVDKGRTPYDELIENIPKEIQDEVLKRTIQHVQDNAGMFRTKYASPNIDHSQEIIKGLQTKGLKYFATDWEKNFNTLPVRKRNLGDTKKLDTGAPVLTLLSALCDHKHRIRLNSGEFNDDRLLLQTTIRGWALDGGVNRFSLYLRDFNSLIPVAYSKDMGNTWIDNPYLSTDEGFDRLNQNVDARYQYSKEYDGIEIGDSNHEGNAVSSNGFTMVQGKNGHTGFNYIDIWTHKKLLPINVDNAKPFKNNKAEFILCGLHFYLTKDDDYNISMMTDFGAMTYNEFMELLKGLVAYKKIKPDRLDKAYKDCLLDPSNPRPK